MSEPWFNFYVVFAIQLLLFIVHAYFEKKLSDVPQILAQGILSGVVLGLLFELVLGKYFGLWSNTLGFGTLFLILNAALLYGLFAAHVLLMQKASFIHFYVWIMLVAAVSEITNIFIPVFTWEFAYLPPFVYLVALSTGYFGGAILVAAVWHIFLRHRFLLIDSVSKV